MLVVFDFARQASIPECLCRHSMCRWTRHFCSATLSPSSHAEHLRPAVCPRS